MKRLGGLLLGVFFPFSKIVKVVNEVTDNSYLVLFLNT